ncbi:MAG: hypothetical protein H8E66_25210 [Planctomycetes bacterium]|nr:hypothetical protein [Planctomycetota bacterium]
MAIRIVAVGLSCATVFAQGINAPEQRETSLKGNYYNAGDRADSQLIVYRLDAITSRRALPDCFPDVPGKAGAALRLAGCRDEYESASLAVYARDDVQQLRLEISDLRSGDHVLPRSAFEAWVVKCWYQAGRDVMFHDGVKRLVPELLLKDDALVRVDTKNETNAVRSTAENGSTRYLPASGKDPNALEGLRPIDATKLQPVTIPGKTLKQFWLTLHIPKDAAAGKYTGSIRLSARGITPVDVPIEVTVHDFELAQPKMIYSIYYPGKLSVEQPQGTIAAHYKSEEQMRAELADMVAHGVRYPNLWQAYSEELVPRALQLRKEAGMPNDRLFINMPAGAPASSAGKVKGWRKLTAGFGYEDIYLYGEDEASGDRLRRQKPSWENVQKAGGKMYASAWKEDPFEVMGSRLNVLVWSGGCQPDKAKRWHSVGSKIFSYSNPQAGVEEPLLYRYNYGLALWKADYDGAMTFAYQWAYGHIWNDFDSEKFREHCFAYPTVNSIVGTIQWEGFREGVDDVRYITTLEQAIEKAGDTEVARTAKRWLAGLKIENARQKVGWKSQGPLPDDLDQIRSRTVFWINQLIIPKTTPGGNDE